MPISVAIDGPAGAGKSTIAKAVSKKLGYIYVDTGALYRTVGLAAIRQNTNLEAPEDVERLLKCIDIQLTFSQDGEQIVLLNHENVGDKIRTPQASMMASAVSALPRVREFLLSLQRDIAKNNNVIMDGRDIATVILPNADVKIFLTASPESRAKRRYDELIAKGEQVEYSDVLDDVNTRDYNDSHRAAAPLKQADDAVLADTTKLDLNQSIQLISDIIYNTLKQKERVV